MTSLGAGGSDKTEASCGLQVFIEIGVGADRDTNTVEAAKHRRD